MELTGRQLGLLVNHWLASPASACARAAADDMLAGWGTVEHLLALAVDELRIANWQRSADGAKGRRPPQRISPLTRAPTTRLGRTELPPEQVKDLLARYGPQEDHSG